jgi:ribulose-phosphate 3-epimerase
LELAGIDRVIAHAESTDDLVGLVSKMKKHDFEVAVAINPETPISVLDEVIKDLDQVLIMTVVPGMAGQSFMASQLPKIQQLRKLHPKLNIAVDGGVTLETIRMAKEAGANRFAANSSIFNAPDPVSAFEQLQAQVV